MIEYAFSTEAAVINQKGEWVSLFAVNTVAIRATRTTYDRDHEEITRRERVLRIMQIGYLGEFGHPKDNPQELDRIEDELRKQLDENIPVWMEGIE